MNALYMISVGYTSNRKQISSRENELHIYESVSQMLYVVLTAYFSRCA